MSGFEYMVLCLLSGVLSEVAGANGSHGRSLLFAVLSAVWAVLAVVADLPKLIEVLS